MALHNPINYAFFNDRTKNQAQQYMNHFIGAITSNKPLAAMGYLFFVVMTYEKMAQQEGTTEIASAFQNLLFEWEGVFDELIEKGFPEEPVSRKTFEYWCAIESTYMKIEDYIDPKFYTGNDDLFAHSVATLFPAVMYLYKEAKKAGIAVDSIGKSLHRLNDAVKSTSQRFVDMYSEMLDVFYNNRSEEVEILIIYHHIYENLWLSLNSLLLVLEVDRDERESEDEIQYDLEVLLGHRMDNLFTEEITVYVD